MTSIPTEWPNFEGMPDDDALTASRPRGQKLATWIWWDGEVRESGSPHVHYYANALHYGTAVFEGIRCYPSARGAVLIRLREHLERMLMSARIYGMRLPFDADALARGALEVTRRNGIQNGYLRPLAYFGAGPIDLKPKRECPVNVFIAKPSMAHGSSRSSAANETNFITPSIRKSISRMTPTSIDSPMK